MLSDPSPLDIFPVILCFTESKTVVLLASSDDRLENHKRIQFMSGYDDDGSGLFHAPFALIAEWLTDEEVGALIASENPDIAVVQEVMKNFR